MKTPLDFIADRQAVWSQTANMLSGQTANFRRTVFILSLAGAVLAALATQLSPDIGFWHGVVAIAGAVALAVAAFLSQRFLNKDALAQPLRARAAAEALKREAYLYATQSGAYAESAGRDTLLADRQRKIETNIKDLARSEQEATGPGSCPRQPLSRDDYVAHRITGQAKWYRERAKSYASVADKLHTAEWMLALIAAIITAAAGVAGTIRGFDLASVTAVLTTLGATIVAHLAATRYDEMIVTYRAAALRLEQLLQRAPVGQPAGDLAAAAEAILEAENNAWISSYDKAAQD